MVEANCIMGMDLFLINLSLFLEWSKNWQYAIKRGTNTMNMMVIARRGAGISSLESDDDVFVLLDMRGED